MILMPHNLSDVTELPALFRSNAVLQVLRNSFPEAKTRT